jgi:hypothetical protein
MSFDSIVHMKCGIPGIRTFGGSHRISVNRVPYGVEKLGWLIGSAEDLLDQLSQRFQFEKNANRGPDDQ